jgi:hypothetical protein
MYTLIAFWFLSLLFWLDTESWATVVVFFFFFSLGVTLWNQEVKGNFLQSLWGFGRLRVSIYWVDLDKVPTATQWTESILARFTGRLFLKPDLWFPINICMSHVPPGCSSSSPISITPRRVFLDRPYNGAWCARASKRSSLPGVYWLQFMVGGSREFSWLFWWLAVFWCGVWYTRTIIGNSLCSF